MRGPTTDAAATVVPVSVQHQPFAATVPDAGMARLKVDAVCRIGGRLLIGGWAVGPVDVWPTSSGQRVEARRWTFARDDVAKHFGLDSAQVGFAFEIAADTVDPVLAWRLPGDLDDRLSTLTVEDLAEPDAEKRVALGPLADAAMEVDPDTRALRALKASGLFDEAFYLSRYADVAQAGGDALTHYYFRGGREGRDPNVLFDSAWYLSENADVRDTGANPLLHYIEFGEAEGRAPSPYFDPAFYRYQLDPAVASSCGPLLGHYLAGGWRTYSPNEYFDGPYYLRCQADVAAAGVEPLSHYVNQGWTENREIHPVHAFTRYRDELQQRLGRMVEPLRYYLLVGKARGDVLPRQGEGVRTGDRSTALADQLRASNAPGPHFEAELIGTDAIAAAAAARVFAFYLPQFHPFPENDRWWGPGFTEWTNVARAMPRFTGHHQPQLPRDLGYYDLRNVDTIRRQVEMARRSGVAGFCFYYYWFDGKRLLDTPVENFLAHRDIDFPFCLMWANENWTRRWDGLEADVLIEQRYREEDDEALVADFARHFEDPRYERVDGRPLLFVYRPGIIPDARRRIARWRELFRELHGVEPLMMMAQCFDDEDPRPFGLDGAIEFPPHKLAKDLPPVNAGLDVFEPDFAGHYLAYDDLVQRSLDVEPQGFDLIRTLVPGWDNEARKPGRGMGFVGSTPRKYEDWLRRLVSWSRDNPVAGGHRYVFVNAWNEWAEGAHLEPDTHFGCAYLNATLRALTGMRSRTGPARELLLIGHDAYRHGAQLLMLNLMRTMRRSFGVEPTLLLMEGGPLLEDYRREGTVHVLAEHPGSERQLLDRIAMASRHRVALSNTVVTGDLVREFTERGFAVTSLIHELPTLVAERGLEPRAAAIAECASSVVFAAEAVRRGFESLVGPLGDRACLRPQGIYQVVDRSRESDAWKRELGIPLDAPVVVNVGYGDLRKGIDLFVHMARRVAAERQEVHFVWVGDLHPDLATWLRIDAADPALVGRLHLVPFNDDVAAFLNGASVMAMTSREDPFPSTVLEALASGVPVVAFDGGGGYVEAISDEEGRNGTVVPMADSAAMADAVLHWIDTDDAPARDARAARAAARYDWRDYAFDLLSHAYPGLSKVSVVVPNYNYARYLPERLSSILEQTYPIYELIVLDDASPDDSLAVIRDVLGAANREARVVVNTANSGSVFRQWEKGACMARGDLVWIAEADDSCTPEFLARALAEWTPATVLGFTDSRQVDGEGRLLGTSYGFYYDDLPDNPLTETCSMGGVEFIRRALAIKNVILNVSAVVFRRSALVEVLEEARETLRTYRMAGDWCLYLELLASPGREVRFIASAENVHRRHATSVTHALQAQAHLDEIERMHHHAQVRVKVHKSVEAAARRYREAVALQLLPKPPADKEETCAES
jgi:glycosyltransferase involved in cell wall biosynthesis